MPICYIKSQDLSPLIKHTKAELLSFGAKILPSCIFSLEENNLHSSNAKKDNAHLPLQVNSTKYMSVETKSVVSMPNDKAALNSYTTIFLHTFIIIMYVICDTNT